MDTSQHNGAALPSKSAAFKDTISGLVAFKAPTNGTTSAPEAGKESTQAIDEGEAKESSDEDDENGNYHLRVNPPPKERKISEKRRADFAVFDSWLERNRDTINEPRQKIEPGPETSAAWLMKDLRAEQIISSPRDYQLELFEVAKQQNTIAVLDTGSGKTLIAALLLRWTIEGEHEDRGMGKPKRISFFLVDKVALVFQQYAVLECNLDCTIERICGDTLAGAGSMEFWRDQLERNMIIVCTAEILYQCLHRAYLRMEQINLLIFDEAHHTKKNHPYARIIKDFYLRMHRQDELRPRILGMTASPVDAQVDVLKAAMELEALLHSRIATPSDPSLLQYSICKPKHEKVVSYAPLPRPFETGLYQPLMRLLGAHDAFRKAFIFTKDASSQLGQWCADWFWHVLFLKEAAGKLEAKTERSFLKHCAFPLARLDTHLSEARQAREIIDSHLFAPVTRISNQLSSKVLVLLDLLVEHFSQPELGNKCIIFVERRYTAIMLAELLQQPGIKLQHMNVGVLVGAGTADAGYEKISFKHHILTIHNFKSGAINCLLATTVAEEGLDIPDCNLVIRFDLYKTTIQYIQSRGRARHEKSTFIHMVEKGNTAHQRAVVQNLANEESLKRFCRAMPEDRKLSGNDINLDQLLRKERSQRRHVVSTTGAVLNYKQSLVVLAQFVASLPHPPETSPKADFLVHPVPGGFECEVLLPSASPIRSATGRQQTSKLAAKCSAAFETCLELLKAGYLNDYLQPKFTKQLPHMRNARLAISSKKKAQYNMRTKPEMWSIRGTPDVLYMHVLLLVDPGAMQRPSRPLLLLTRQPIPPLPDFRLFFSRQRSSEARFIPLSAVLAVDAAVVGSLTCFTLTIFKDIFSKEYEAEASQLPYFLAPSCRGHDQDFSNGEDSGSCIDWDLLKRFAGTSASAVTFRDDAPDDFYREKFVTDPWNGSRKFFLRGKRPDLKPRDRVPEGVVPPSSHVWKEATHDIINYSVSLWSKSRSKFTWREDQPVVEAEMVSLRRNLLDEHVEADDDAQRQRRICFLILEPLRISALPVETVAMAYNFPALIHRIESHLIAIDACRMLDLDIAPALALEAVTKDSDNTEEHGEEQINFQGGMGNNYERLEFLGDSFLKLATTISIFTLTRDKNEFECHVERMLLVCNQNLFNHALDAKVEEYVRSKKFDRGTWYPEGLNQLKGKKHAPKKSHVLGDKSIADVCEALIGAAYLTARKRGNFDLAVQAVTTMVKNENHRMKNWAEYYAAYIIPDWQTAPAREVQLHMANIIASKAGYTFTHPRLLRSAFMHPSWPRTYEQLPSYQRLEFLGDALLDMVCVDYLFDSYPGADPQWLTEHKMAMVSNQFLGCLCVQMGFQKHMIAMSELLTTQIAEYERTITATLEAAKVEAVQAGKKAEEYNRSYWVDALHPPKCLPDIVEAYLGAMFVDSRYDYALIQSFFTRHILPYFADMRPYNTYANKHPVTLMIHRLDIDMHCNQHRICDREVPLDAEVSCAGAEAMGQTQVVSALMVHRQVVAHASAGSGRYARTAMARKVNELLEGLGREEFKAKYGCDCQLGEGQEAKRTVALDEQGLPI